MNLSTKQPFEFEYSEQSFFPEIEEMGSSLDYTKCTFRNLSFGASSAPSPLRPHGSLDLVEKDGSVPRTRPHHIRKSFLSYRLRYVDTPPPAPLCDA